jgi:Peptidase of plants and bacteria
MEFMKQKLMRLDVSPRKSRLVQERFAGVQITALLLFAAGLLTFHICAAQTDSGTNLSASDRTTVNEISWSGTATNAQGETMLTITVDPSQAPDLAAWGKHAGELCAEWYPKICALLASDGFTPPRTVRLRFRDGRGVAATGGGTISINAIYVRRATNDFGMVIHELTHVVQSYHRGNTPGWLTEGIADNIRLSHFEPPARRPRINPEKANYTDAYKTTAIFLEWVEKKYDEQLVTKLNQAAREGKFQIELFKDYTGKTVDELWAEFADSLRGKEKAASVSPAVK